jgi:hypothetical protein
MFIPRLAIGTRMITGITLWFFEQVENVGENGYSAPYVRYGVLAL